MMIYILSLGLTVFLLIAVVLVINPHLISPSLAARWIRNHTYKRH